MDFTGHNANHAYYAAVKATMHSGNDMKFSNNVDSGLVRELRPTLISFPMHLYRFIDLRDDFNLAFAYAEVLTILAGFNDDTILKHYNKNISTYANDDGIFNAPYGERIRRDWGDQLKIAVNKLKENDKTRQAVIQIWHPVKDNQSGFRDYACNNVSYLLIRNSTLEWTQVMRSNDLIWGLPYNVVQFGSLMQIAASILGLDCGMYRHFCNSSHIYDKHFDEANKIINDGLTQQHSPEHKKVSKLFKAIDFDELEKIISFLLIIEEETRNGNFKGADSIKDWPISMNNAFFDLGVVLIAFNMIKKKELELAMSWTSLLLDGSYEKKWLQVKINKKLG